MDDVITFDCMRLVINYISLSLTAPQRVISADSLATLRLLITRNENFSSSLIAECSCELSFASLSQSKGENLNFIGLIRKKHFWRSFLQISICMTRLDKTLKRLRLQINLFTLVTSGRRQIPFSILWISRCNFI